MSKFSDGYKQGVLDASKALPKIVDFDNPNAELEGAWGVYETARKNAILQLLENTKD